MKNKYLYRFKISDKKFRKILQPFCVDIEAKKASDLTGISPCNNQYYFDKLRVLIAEKCGLESPFDTGEIELDESYFGASGKTPVFGMLKRNDNAYTQVIKTCKMADISPIIEKKSSKESTLYTDGFKTYDGLVNYGYKKHFSVKHSQNELAQGKNHIDRY